MRVSELIEALAQLPHDLEVLFDPGDGGGAFGVNRIEVRQVGFRLSPTFDASNAVFLR